MSEPLVAHLKSPYLPYHQTYLYDLLRLQPQGAHYVFTDKVQNLEQFPWRPIVLFRDFHSLLYLLRGQHPQVVHAHFGHNGIRALRLKRNTHLPLLTTLYNTDLTARPKQDAHYRELLQELFREGDFFTVASQSMRKHALSWGCPPDKLRVIHFGVDLGTFTYEPRLYAGSGELQIVTISRLTEKRGIDIVIEAMAQLKAANVEARLTIVGGGEEGAALEELCQQSGVAERVVFTGALDHSQVHDILRKTDLFVLCSQRAANGDEDSIPVAIMEAMAVGRPVISTFVGGIPELINDRVQGCLIPPRDPKALTQRIMEYVRNPKGWLPYLGSARAKVEKDHDASQQAAKMNELYLELLR